MIAADRSLFLTAVGCMAATHVVSCEEVVSPAPSNDPSAASGPHGTASSGNGSGGTNTEGRAGAGGDGGNSGGGNAPGGAGSGGGGTGANCEPPAGTPDALELTPVASGLTWPVLLTQARGDDERFYIAEQGGQVLLLKGGSSSVFLDISSKVVQSQFLGQGDERGLLGLAFHPSYAQNGRFFVHYNDLDSDTVIEEYRRSPSDPDLADPAAVATILTRGQPYANHNGGSIEFNPMDGFLYIGLGDGGDSSDPLEAGQSTNIWLGKILRLDVDNGSPYAIPSGNLTGAGVLPEIYDYGLRNPWRFSFDPCTGDRYVGDVGQAAWEEISVAANGDGNKNFGWNTLEANHCFDPPSGCDFTGLTLAADEYAHAGNAAVTGGYVYRGSNIPWLRGAYLYGDFVSGQVWSFRWQAGSITGKTELTTDLIEAPINISSFGQDNRGEIYVVAYGYITAGAGVVYRVDPE